MSEDAITQAEVDALFDEHEAFIRKVRIKWVAENRPRSRDVYEVMSSASKQEVHNIIDRWARYVTPLAEAWWKERGYGVVWPDNDSEPMQIYKLETEGA